MAAKNNQHRSARRAEGDQTQAHAPTRTPAVYATICPGNPLHRKTRVYRTKDRTRYCVCDDCGRTWKQIGPEAGEVLQPVADDEATPCPDDETTESELS